MRSRLPIGQHLIGTGCIDPDQLTTALTRQRQQGGRVGDALVALGFLPESVLLLELARNHGVPFVEVGRLSPRREILRHISDHLVRKHRALPIGIGVEGGRRSLFVATNDPENLSMLDDFALVTGMTVKPVLVGDGDLERAIERNLGEAYLRETLN
jgi:type IV pilus assembly protein PilB